MINKRIILFIDSLGTGGAQRQLVNLAVGLKKKNLAPLLVFYNSQFFFEEVITKYKIEYTFVKRKNILDVFFLFKMVGLIRKEKPKWVISFLFMPSFYALLIKLFFPKLKILVSERSFEQKTSFFEKLVIRRLYFLTTFITANSLTQTRFLQKRFPKYLSRIKYIPNGTLDQKLNYNFNNSQFTIVSIGRVSDLKSTKLLINAVAQLKQRFYSVNFKVYWVGSKYNSNTSDLWYFEECVKLIEDHNLQSIWEWTGQITNVQSILMKASLLVHMSSGEGFPNAICESMSLGVPVIASHVMDHPNIIIDKYNGYLVQSGDLDGLLAAFVAFINLTIEEKYVLSKNAYDTAIQSFSNKNMVNKYFNLLSSIN